MARGSAKIILFGEHAVVHGRLAVAAAIDQGARATLTRCGGTVSRVRLIAEPAGASTAVTISTEGGNDDARALRALLDSAGLTGQAFAGELAVDVPAGAGLGCSAAMAVALARALSVAAGMGATDAELAAWAMAWERVYHGNPSGVDVAVSLAGGVIAFRKDDMARPVILPEAIELAIASTGEPCSTRDMVDQVARQLSRRPQIVERTFDGIDALAMKSVGALEGGRWYEVGRLMDLNHALLSSLLVSTEALERACNLARGAGALGAKLTGGGGGGCAIALAPGKTEQVLEAWRAAGITGFASHIDAARRVGSNPPSSGEPA